MVTLAQLPTVRIHPFRLRLRSRFRGLVQRDGVLIEGPGGWGEFAPFADYSAGQDARWMAAAIEGAVGAVPHPLRADVGANGILSDASTRLTAVDDLVTERGCRTIKVKVGAGGLEADFARVSALRDRLDALLGPGVGRIRIDANGRWTLDEAIAGLLRLAPLGIEYAEQPCATPRELRELRAAGSPIPVAVDEAIRRDEDPAVAEYADVAVLKPGPLGGGRRTLALAASIGLPVVISGALESSVGLSRDAVVAAALPTDPPDCGLATGALLATDVRCTVLPVRGRVAAQLVEPEPAALAAVAVADGGWEHRCERAWATALASDLIPAADIEALR